ncbi:pectinesterase inhibitor-like [Juglans microcarpa x Juglans regia]|uniref:pectinesterase inhibitor-like n=1 Tax=Juglans microcarpa x Juglans regia TaxID=2249226 RepID=UPI001B7DBC69|nr:pectinesterase inhibitor-like [Juglans microcarpa x Juglans regia]
MKPILKLFFGLLFTLCPYTIFADNKDLNLITTACDRTLYKDLCRAVLLNHPKARTTTELRVLARVALKYALISAKQVETQIRKLKDAPAALKDCAENFQSATQQISYSFKALKSKSYGDINIWVSAAMTGVDSCEEGFKELKSNYPIDKSSKIFNQLCSIVLAFTNQLNSH